MPTTSTSARIDRRAFLAGAGATVAAGAIGSTGSVRAQSGSDDLASWFEDTDNYDGVVDERGEDRVTVKVGAEGNGGPFAFEPAAIHVDSGTTVVWEWTGEGGAHNVAAADGSYESDLLSSEGATYALTFDGEGVSRYACVPHEAMGMKGAVVVGSASAGGAAVSPEVAMFGGSVLAAVLSPLAFGLFLFLRGRGGARGEDDAPRNESVTPRSESVRAGVPGAAPADDDSTTIR
ncbi:halocyanin domain-containing protein [Halomarina pelagica]|uniref:halocyanin domain-containing protein n=1 Tax=Halomarina pelagica TaxID=2961599 RepID=UPI0020C1DD6F|nr:halocyanin domain-containing protein [Halomarina sp. BND7]